jgi:hypothetical protein
MQLMLGDLVEFHKTVKRPQLAKILNYCYVRVPAPRNSPHGLLLEKTQRRKMLNKNLQEKKHTFCFSKCLPFADEKFCSI